MRRGWVDPNADPAAQGLGAAAQPGGDGEAATKKGEEGGEGRASRGDPAEEPSRAGRAIGSGAAAEQRVKGEKEETERLVFSVGRPPKGRGEDPGDAPSAPGRLASLTLQRCAELDAVAENDPLRALDILVQRLKAMSAVAPPGQLDLGGAAGAGQGHVPARAQSRPAGGPHRLVAPTPGGRGERGGRRYRAPAERPRRKRKGQAQEGEGAMEVTCEEEGSQQGSAGSRAGLAPLEIPILKQVLDGMPDKIGQQRAQIDKHLANVNVAQAYRTIIYGPGGHRQGPGGGGL